MATVGKFNGTAFGVYMDGVLIAYSTSASLSISMDTVNCQGPNSGGWMSRAPSGRDWEISCDALMTMETGNRKYYQIFSSYIDVRSVFDIAFKTDVSGDYYFYGKAICTGMDIDASMEETATFSVSFVAAGDLDIAQVA